MRYGAILTAIAVLFLVACKSTTPPPPSQGNQPPPVKYEQGPQAPGMGPRTFTPGVPVAPIQHNPFTITTNDPAVTVPVQQPVSITTTSGIAFFAHGLMAQTNVENGPMNMLSVSNVYSGAAIQAALDLAKRIGKTEVIVPTGTYALTNALHVWTGVSLHGYGRPTLLRTYHLIGNTNTLSYTGERFSVYLHGNQTFSGFTVFGNATNWIVATNGVGILPNSSIDSNGNVEQTEYGEVVIQNTGYDYGPNSTIPLTEVDEVVGQPGQVPTIVDDCVFRWCSGSAVKVQEAGGRGVIVRNCRVNEYYDHGIYWWGMPNFFGTNAPGFNNMIIGNTVSWPSATRGNGAIKLRNNCFRCLVVGNTLEVPNDGAFAVDVGDDIGGDAPVQEILITGNTVNARRIVEFSGTAAAPHNVHFVGNDCAASDYFLLGFSGVSGAPSGDFFIANNYVRNTDLSKSLLSIVRGEITNGASWRITGNHFYGPCLHQLFGKLNVLDFSGNDFIDQRAGTNIDLAVQVGLNNAMTAASHQWTFANNHLVNWATFFFDDSDTTSINGTFALNTANLTFKGNKMTGHPTQNNLMDLRGTNSLAYTGANTLTYQDNICDLIPLSIPATSAMNCWHVSPTTINQRGGGTIVGGTNNLNALLTIHTPYGVGDQSALSLNNPYDFGTGTNTAGVAINAYRLRPTDATTNPPTARIAMGNGLETTSGSGYMKLQVADNAQVLQSVGYLRDTGGQLYNLTLTNGFEGLGTTAPASYGAKSIVHDSISGITPYGSQIGTGGVWRAGQNAGILSTDDTFGWLSQTFGSVPVLQLRPDGIVTLGEGSIYAPIGQTLFLGPDNNSGHGTTTVSGNLTVNDSISADLDLTAGNTRLLLWDVTGGGLKRVSIGTNDSAGAGFRILKVPN